MPHVTTHATAPTAAPPAMTAQTAASSREANLLMALILTAARVTAMTARGLQIVRMTQLKKKALRTAGSVDLEIGDRIRTLRLARDVTQQGLADRIGVTFQQLQKYERGTNRVSASRLLDIANALGAAVTELLPATTNGQNGSAADLAKLITFYMRLNGEDKQRVLDYVGRLADRS